MRIWNACTRVVFYSILFNYEITVKYKWKWLKYFSKNSPWRQIHVCIRLTQFPKHFCHSARDASETSCLNAPTAYPVVEKRWPRKRVIGCQIPNALECSKLSRLRQYVRSRIVLSSSAVGIPQFSKNFWEKMVDYQS